MLWCNFTYKRLVLINKERTNKTITKYKYWLDNSKAKKIKVKFETFNAGKVTLEWNANLPVLGPNYNIFLYQKMWSSGCKESKSYNLPFGQAVVSICTRCIRCTVYAGLICCSKLIKLFPTRYLFLCLTTVA